MVYLVNDGPYIWTNLDRFCIPDRQLDIELLNKLKLIGERVKKRYSIVLLTYFTNL